MKRKRKPPKATRRSDNYQGPRVESKGRQKTHLTRFINEEIQ